MTAEITGASGIRSHRAAVQARVLAVMAAARYFGTELDPTEFAEGPSGAPPSASALSQWAASSGLWSRAVRIRWNQLVGLHSAGPVVILLKEGGAVLMVAADADRQLVTLRSPSDSAGANDVEVDRLRLSEAWAGEVVLLRAARGASERDPAFTLSWLARLVSEERRSLVDIAVASFTISLLTIFPPLIVMATVNRVLQYHSTSTLVLLSVLLAIIFLYETVLGHARRLITAVVGARIDTRLSLSVFARLLRLPVEFFENHPTGEVLFRLGKLQQVRGFITGKLLATLLDLVTLAVLMPVLFFISPALSWIVLGCAVAILLVILAFLRPMRSSFARLTETETVKFGVLGETVAGVRTIKSLALEPVRRGIWDCEVAEASKRHLAFSRLANWPQTIVTPIERFMTLGTMMIGTYLALSDQTGILVGSLFAFMMLSGRVAQPLVGLAKLVEDLEEVGAAVSEVGYVLNRPMEDGSQPGGLRPQFEGAVTFNNVTFTYPGSKIPALRGVRFAIPAGTMLGVVGRSGSGKSTITRLLQGINREYEGSVKIDGFDLKEINLRHLRQSFGVVLQENFLFRGTIRENIIAGRPGLTLADAVRAARLAGAEEFIERLPGGFETYVEEGSPNLSGGQRQRLAIARALVANPRLIILDEATSALDPESEAIVNENLMRIARGRTMIVVSHRLSSLTECDQILVLDQGQVLDVAPHDVLLERCDVYRQLWQQQNRHLDTRRRPVAVPARLVGHE